MDYKIKITTRLCAFKEINSDFLVAFDKAIG
jgi:hypothetical protein